MTTPRRVRGIAAVIATLAAATLATTAQGDAHAATGTAGGGADKAARTSLHLHITGCDSCSVQLYQAIDGRLTVWHSAKQKIGPDHRVVFRVPTRRTHGMSFTLDAPWAKGLDHVPNMVTRYRGHAIDSFVKRQGARTGKHAEGCWAGTSTSGRLQLDFAVSRVRSTTVTGKPAHAPLVYATHTMSSWKPMVKTYKGMIGNQDAFYCQRPPMTKVTFEAPGCDGCEMQVMNGAFRLENTWSADPQQVTSGEVTFRVPRPLTKGITATVLAPWEGATGYTTVVAFRYAGHQKGDPVTFSDARDQRHGSPCWGGAKSKNVTLALTTRQVTVPGTTGSGGGDDRLRRRDPVVAQADDARSQGRARLARGHRLPPVTAPTTPRRYRTRRGVVVSSFGGFERSQSDLLNHRLARNMGVTRLGHTARHGQAGRLRAARARGA